MSAKAKLILVDPSISGTGGHYLEYAARILTAARELGLDPVLATNRLFEPTPDTPWPVIPIFRYDFWGHDLGAAKAAATTFDAVAQKSLRVQYSRLGLFLAAARNLPRLKLYTSEFPVSPRALRRLRRAHEIHRIMQALEVLDRQAASESRGLQGYLKRLRRAIIASRNPHERASLLAMHGGSNEVDHDPSTFTKLDKAAERAQSFAACLRNVLESCAVSEACHVFIPTAGLNELAGLSELFKHAGLSHLPTYHLLFRRDLFKGNAETFDAQGWETYETRTAFAVLRTAAANTRLRLYTDTEPLTKQYNRLDAGDVKTVGIPVDRTHRNAAKSNTTLTLAYLGDARQEKGFQYLPKCMDAWPHKDLKRRIELRAQFYLAGVAPDVAMLTAGEILRQSKHIPTTLIERPLASNEYNRELEQADILLIPYSRQNYEARSSGIFAEALAMGVPVVVTAGTWMAAELDKLTFKYHEMALKNAEVVRNHNLAESSWRAYYGSQDFRFEQFVVGPNTIAVKAAPTAFAQLSAPNAATHVWLTFKHKMTASDPWTFVIADFKDARGHDMRSEEVVLGGAGDHTLSTLLAIPPGTQKLWIGLRTAFTQTPHTIVDAQASFVRLPRGIGAGGIGLTFIEQTSEDASALKLSQAIQNVANNYDYYAANAFANVESWTNIHSARSVVNALAAEASPMTSNHRIELRRYSAHNW